MAIIPKTIWEQEKRAIQEAILAGLKYHEIANKLKKPGFEPTLVSLLYLMFLWQSKLNYDKGRATGEEMQSVEE
jgi:hypothetical protein